MKNEKLKRICIIDGQGGGIGATLVKYLRMFYGERVELVALGTNAIAASAMLKAGATQCASGENAIQIAVEQADCIAGPVAITWPNSMMGEVTTDIARAITSSPAPKVILPISQENVILVGFAKEPLPHLVQEAVNKIREIISSV
ncbi:conserved hypothetical protein [Desulfamplus magnetovallimortis]|uniref:DUF3842 family protein n=1 Tax=Desulfamplus magnetovallimortis TaxID=1246637 RepID=A0A1W1HHG0_9BACT|nr:DUF3842 family protein [Desulfamplus magnetovallimortis]SLM31880.1 conserved hypothetical protein [Desulfamplus magnetovallimortis]